MDKDKRRGWLKELKENDEVAYVRNGTLNRIGKIEKISPTGRITIGKYIFDYDGIERTKSANCSPSILKPLTQEIKDNIKKKEICDKLNNCDWEKFSVEKLEKIMTEVLS